MCCKKNEGFAGLHSHIEHLQLEMALGCINKKLCRIEKLLKCHANLELEEHEHEGHDNDHEEHEEHGHGQCNYCR